MTIYDIRNQAIFCKFGGLSSGRFGGMSMGKAKMLGYNKPYIPNNQADKRKKKRGRNPADRIKNVKDMNVPDNKK